MMEQKVLVQCRKIRSPILRFRDQDQPVVDWKAQIGVALPGQQDGWDQSRHY